MVNDRKKMRAILSFKKIKVQSNNLKEDDFILIKGEGQFDLSQTNLGVIFLYMKI